MRFQPILILSAGLLLAADAKDDVAAEIKKLEGTWIVESFESKGKVSDKEKGQEFIVTADKMGLKKPNGKIEEVSYTIDPAKKPKVIDLSAGKEMIPGIYELDGDTLKICFAEDSKDRPTEFATKEDNRNRLMVLKRQKK